MEQDQFQQLPSAPFPAPPPFWKHFTSENVEKLATIKAATEDNHVELPLSLICLRPPPPPPVTADTYTTFSIPQALNPTPASPPQDILLFDPKSPTFNPATLLSRLTKSVLLNFLELTTILGSNPMEYEEKMADINRIMLNIHFVINMYRPHQAREGVRDMLQSRLDEGKREIEDCDVMKRKVEHFLRSIEQKGTETMGVPQDLDDTSQARTPTTDEDEESRKLWSMIHQIDLDMTI